MKLFEIKNQQPEFLLTESKNVHLEHLEDLVFNKGWSGAKEALNYIDSLRHMLAEGTGATTQLTVKWDGSPAIICGIDPDDGRFFVGTKSVFSKGNPRRCKSTKDIQAGYGDQPELADMLEAALKYLRELRIGGIVQGDLMFTPGDLSVVNVNDEDCYVFTPNTITYAVPVKSQLGQRIAGAQIGIIFHTTYIGDDWDTLSAEFGVNVSGFTQTKNVWFDDATYKDYTGVASLTPSENTKIQQYLQATADTMQKLGESRFNVILQDKEFSRMIKPFVNQQIRSGTQVGEPTQFLQKFINHYEQEQMKGIEQLSGGLEGRAAQARVAKIKAREDWIADNSNNLLGVLAVYKRIIELKGMLIHKLNQVEGIGTFQKTNDGYKVTSPEGFVAIGHDGGAVKLVDRLTFSRTNFLAKA
jgi:hypothetical protein